MDSCVMEWSYRNVDWEDLLLLWEKASWLCPNPDANRSRAAESSTAVIEWLWTPDYSLSFIRN